MHDPVSIPGSETAGPSRRKRAIRDAADRMAARRQDFLDRNQAFHGDEIAFLRFLIPEGQRVLELGCGTGSLLAALKPSRGVGLDISAAMVEEARRRHPDLEFHQGDCETAADLAALGGPFDAIILADTVGMLDDVERTLGQLHGLCHADTRVVIAYYNYLWEPVLRLGERLGLRMPTPEMNWLMPADIDNLIHLADFEPVRHDWRQLIPYGFAGLGGIVNRYVATLPGIRQLCLRHYVVARSKRLPPPANPSCTVLVPARNEKGNIAAIVERLPQFCDDLEIVFVEGHSQDGTYEEMERVRDATPQRDIKVFRQDGKGKGDAVRKGFANARGDILMILDADMTVPPEDLPKFYAAIAGGKGEFINGSRLVYPMEKEAMRFLNRIANHAFSLLFTWLLNQRFTDTLCGTKVLWRHHYDRIVAGRSYFGDFDPFGDFDLIFGASKLSLKIVEVPIRYAARTYGETQISRFSHGWLLLRMVVFAYSKLKAFRVA